MKGLTKANLVALAVPLALLGGAYGFQYIGGLVPCEMCWWQRYAHFAALAFAVLAFLAKGQRWLVGLAALLLYLWHARGNARALFSLNLFRNRTFSLGLGGSFEP